ncbi:hypothetical protein Pcinc_019970 [Petrolisthes cinctipes]|uniref:Ig-like domain-containing protein n=1 Tax=Petrolisthes cinctipes TaxID=88211 RepID=A0AAE1KKF5_PETCI|nr:hypothetical protein Pcinc_019970 [Petrolisthes cinctipes]
MRIARITQEEDSKGDTEQKRTAKGDQDEASKSSTRRGQPGGHGQRKGTTLPPSATGRVTLSKHHSVSSWPDHQKKHLSSSVVSRQVTDSNTALPLSVAGRVTSSSTVTQHYSCQQAGIDSRKGALDNSVHWSGIEERAHFNTDPPNQGLVVTHIHPHDHGEYRCRVDFGASPTRNIRVKLVVVGVTGCVGGGDADGEIVRAEEGETESEPGRHKKRCSKSSRRREIRGEAAREADERKEERP